MDPRQLSLHPIDWIKTEADKKWLADGGFIDPKQLYKLCDFCTKCLVILDGVNAGKPFEFHEWFLRDVLFPLYAMKKSDGTRRFSRGCVFCPKKVGKTTSLAAVTIFELIQPRAEVYILSSALESASAMFKAIADFLKTSPVLAQPESGKRNNKLPWLRENLKKVEYDQSILKVLSGDKTGKSGHNISFLACDEICEFTDVRAFERMADGGKYRKEPICPLSITTPLYDRNSLAWEQYCYCQKILSGQVIDTSFLAVIHGLPTDCDWQNPDNWWKYLSGLGDLVNKDQYLAEYERRQDNPREMVAFRNYYLCQWADSVDCWLDMDRYHKQVKDIDLSELKGKRCWLALDGAFTGLAALIAFFPDQKIVYPWFFHPKETAQKYDAKYHTHYQAWSQAGFVTLTDGDMFDWQTILCQITAISEQFEVIELVFDPYSLEGRISDYSLTLPFRCIPIPPFKSYVARPTLHLERLVYAQELTFANNPILEWNASVARVKRNAHDTITLDRDQVSIGQRYDGIAALILAIGQYLQQQEQGLTLENGIILL